MAGKTQIHELIAVEKDAKATTTKIIDETFATFTKKAHLFSTHAKLYESLNAQDNEKPEEEKAKPIGTVSDKLAYFQKQLSKHLDIIVQKEEANCRAYQDIIIHTDDAEIVIAEKVPVQALVQFETILESIRTKVFDEIPTLDPAKHWADDTAAGKGFKISDTVRQQRTRKEQQPITLHEGNEKHPPQVQLISKDVVTGHYTTTYFSGNLTPAEKSEVMSRLDLVIKAVKTARARANTTEVTSSLKLGQKLFKYILEGK